MQKSLLESRIELLLQEKKVTEQRINQDLSTFDNPFDRLDYLNNILTYHGVGTLKAEDDLPSLIAHLQGPEIQAAREISMRDGLTGVYNRREIENNMRNPKDKYCILMLDIDDFKKINDEYGHNIGDLVLKNVTKIILENIRESFIGRYGGEEFYVELNLTDKHGGAIAAERIRKAIENNLIDYLMINLQKQGMEIPRGLSNRKVTISIGVADEKQGTNLLDVREKADKALYQAKNQGRNKVIIY